MSHKIIIGTTSNAALYNMVQTLILLECRVNSLCLVLTNPTNGGGAQPSLDIRCWIIQSIMKCIIWISRQRYDDYFFMPDWCNMYDLASGYQYCISSLYMHVYTQTPHFMLVFKINLSLPPHIIHTTHNYCKQPMHARDPSHHRPTLWYPLVAGN
jgi:hypothetical protein